MAALLRLSALTCTLAIFGLLSGCGGGSSGGSTSFGRITGNAYTSASRAPSSSAPITVTIAGTSLAATTTLTGAFSIDQVPPGLYTLVAKTPQQAIAVVVKVAAGSEAQVGDLILKDAGQVSGLVTSASDGSPIAGAAVTVTDVVTTNDAAITPQPIRSAITDAAGSYAIDWLPAGDYLVTAVKTGFQTASLAVTITAGATTPGDIKLTPYTTGSTGTMAGKVTAVLSDGTSQPLAGALVRLAVRGDPMPLRPLPATAAKAGGGTVSYYGGTVASSVIGEFYAFTDDTGAYNIDGVTPGTYTAVAVRPGFDPDSKSVTITAGATTAVDFTLKERVPQTGTLTGTVTDSATNAPIAGAVVGLRWLVPVAAAGSTGGSAPGSTGSTVRGSVYISPPDINPLVTTDANGKFTMRAPVGTIAYYVAASGYDLFTGSADIAAGGTTTVTVALIKASGKTVTLSGTVSTKAADGSLTPTAGADVHADQVDITMGSASPVPRPTLSYTTTSAADGTFTMAVLPGHYLVYATKDPLSSAPTVLDVEADTTVKLILEPWAVPLVAAK